jgi:hypothetical protein
MLRIAWIFLVLCCAQSAWAQSPAESNVASSVQTDERSLIERAALDYAEGWYEGNPEMMEQALHPDLAKRIVRKKKDAETEQVDHMTAETLIDYTRRGGGKATPADEQIKKVTILDVGSSCASVKLEMRDFIDYLHIGKVNGQWKIINVLWEMRSTPKQSD